MNNLIIWSKNRACQLHLLLESLSKYSASTFSKIIIVYKSDPSFEDGYTLLKKRFTKPIFLNETNFQDSTLEALHFKADNISLSTDDTVCIDSFDLSNLSLKNDVFSLRLGLNTIIQDSSIGSTQTPINRYSIDKDIISWNFTDYNAYTNYGYILGLDMHLFNREKILNIIQSFPFSSANNLEAKLLAFRPHFRYLKSFVHSKMVNIPNNNISKYNGISNKTSYDSDALQKKYMEGYVISIPLIKKTKIIGCHQEIPYTMVKYG